MSELTEAKTLRESIIDVADQHTTLDHIGKKGAAAARGRSTGRPRGKVAGAAPLPLETATQYRGLFVQMAGKTVAYSDVRGSAGKVLERLGPAYEDNKFWHRIVPRTGLDQFPSSAWWRMLPIEARLTQKVSFVGDPSWTQKFSPVPRVLLFPFGWSAWLSLKVSGAHSIRDLGDVVRHLFTGRCLQPDGTANPVSLDQYMSQVGDGVRSDAFGAGAKDVSNPELFAATTALSKSGPSPALGALTDDDQTLLVRLVRPDDRPSARTFSEFVMNLVPADGLNYVLRADRKYCLWCERKLGGDKRSGIQVRCYHNNTFSSLVRVGHLQTLLNQASTRPRNASLDELVAAALDESSRLLHPGTDEMSTPYYKNAALKEFSGIADLQKSVTTAQQRMKRK